jgi:hypothetical protein
MSLERFGNSLARKLKFVTECSRDEKRTTYLGPTVIKETITCKIFQHQARCVHVKMSEDIFIAIMTIVVYVNGKRNEC